MIAHTYISVSLSVSVYYISRKHHPQGFRSKILFTFSFGNWKHYPSCRSKCINRRTGRLDATLWHRQTDRPQKKRITQCRFQRSSDSFFRITKTGNIQCDTAVGTASMVIYVQTSGGNSLSFLPRKVNPSPRPFLVFRLSLINQDESLD